MINKKGILFLVFILLLLISGWLYYSSNIKKSEKFNEELNKNKNKAKMTSLLEDSGDKEEYYNGIRIFNPEDSLEEVEAENEEQIETNTENE